MITFEDIDRLVNEVMLRLVNTESKGEDPIKAWIEECGLESEALQRSIGGITGIMLSELQKMGFDEDDLHDPDELRMSLISSLLMSFMVGFEVAKQFSTPTRLSEEVA